MMMLIAFLKTSNLCIYINNECSYFVLNKDRYYYTRHYYQKNSINDATDCVNNEPYDSEMSMMCMITGGKKLRNTVLPVKVKHVTQIVSLHGVFDIITNCRLFFVSFSKRMKIN